MPRTTRHELKAPPPPGTAFVLEAHVAGVPYYDFADGELPLDPGSRLQLRREPDNPHDERAIELYTLDGHKLGYVPRRRNPMLSRLMDAGFKMSARLEVVKTPARCGVDPDVSGVTKPRLRFAAFIHRPDAPHDARP